MNTVRVVALFVTLVSVAAAGPPRAVLRTRQYRPSETRSGELAFIGVDGKALHSPQRQLTLSPGRHTLSLRLWFLVKGRVETVDIPFTDSFKGHHYMIGGGFIPSGVFRMIVEDEDERPPGVKSPNAN
jgi:hypothetical protein